MALGSAYRNADETEKRWQWAAFTLFMANAPVLLLNSHLMSQAANGCEDSGGPCLREVLAANSVADKWMYLSFAVALAAVALPPQRRMRVWRVALMAVEGVAMLAQILTLAAA